MDSVPRKIHDPSRCDVDELQLVSESAYRIAVKCGVDAASSYVGRAEYPAASEGCGVGEEGGMNLYPSAPSRVKQRGTMVGAFRDLIVPFLIAKLQNLGLNGRVGGRRNENVDVAHRPEVRLGIVLVGD